MTQGIGVPPIRVDMLGGLRLLANQASIDRFRTHKTAALLAFLAYHRQQPHARETVIEMFWPDLSLEAGRNSLSVTLSSLRRLFAPLVNAADAERVVLAGRTTVQFNPALLTTDTACFEATLRRWQGRQGSPEAPPEERKACLEEAARLYRGPLLPGYYQDWIPLEQTRLEALCLEALRELATLRWEAGEVEGAIEALNRAVALDRLREETQQELIRLLLRIGRPALALHRYRQFAGEMQEQLGMEPQRATQDLIAPLNGRSPVNRPAPPLAKPHLRNPASVQIEAEEAERDTDLPGSRSLPARFDRFFGREEEREQLLTLLSGSARLLTITGMGGVGKTRLAVETAETLATERAVLFVPLADVHEAEHIPEALRRMLELPVASPEETLRGIVGSLGAQPLLLILDNFEQLLPEGAPFVRELLTRVPSLQCLVTSRRRLLLDAEEECPLAPLPPPPSELHASSAKQTPDTLLHSAALALFVDRARAHRAGFELNARNASAVVQLVRNLEGLPLALELAAARTAILTPRQMLDSLAKRPFDLLTGHRSDRPERHRSLRETILWSYRLLPTPVQAFFRDLAVFRGGWTLEAAQAITADDSTLDHLAQLRDASLLLTRHEEPNEILWFDMLVSLRAFTVELFETNPERETIRRRHADYFTALVESAARSMHGPEESSALRQLEGEYENVRAAFHYLIVLPEGTPQAARLACALLHFWCMQGNPTEGIAWMERILEQGGLSTSARAQTLARLAQLKTLRGDTESVEAMLQESLRLFREEGDEAEVARLLCDRHREPDVLQEGMALARRLGDERSLALALEHLGVRAWQNQDRQVAEQYFQESVAISRRRGEAIRQLGTLSEWAYMLLFLGEYARASRLLEEARRLGVGRVGDWHSHIDWMRGVVATNLGDYGAARLHLERSAATRRRHGACQALGTTLLGLIGLHYACGDYEAAQTVVTESMHVWQEIGSVSGLGYTRYDQARLALYAGQSAQARRLLEENLVVFRDPLNSIGLGSTLYGLGLVALHETDWRAAEAHFQEALQVRWSLKIARSCIEILQGIAIAAAGQTHWERCLLLAGAAESWRESIGLVIPAADNARIQTALAQARQALGEENAERHFQAGMATSPADAIARRWSALLPDKERCLDFATAIPRKQARD